MTTADTSRPSIDSAVPQSLDAGNWSAIEPILDDLDAREIASADDLRRWLTDRSELDASYLEADTNRYIAMTCDTNDEAAQAAYSSFVESIPPKYKPRSFALDRKLVDLEHHLASDNHFEVLLRDTRAAVEIYRDENVPLETKLSKLEQSYGQVIGSMNVEFDGEEKTLPQMAVYLESTDRRVRQSAWTAVARRRLTDAVRLDDIFDEMVQIRDQVARNANEPTFIEYGFKAKQRFDYTPADCEAFHDAVAKHVVPFNNRSADRRRKQLGVDVLRPWDLQVDPKGRGPLKPFEGGLDLFEKTRRVFGRLDLRLAGMFIELGKNLPEEGFAIGDSLDLDSRKGKAPGGYQAMRDRKREPFIFMNAAGVHRDVETMVHEAGHAFHSMQCVSEPLVHYRHSPIEFAEVASMTMELLSMPYWDEYYPDESDLNRARRNQLESSIGMLAWIASVDAFQHWVYRNPTHTRAQRTEHWLSIDSRFGYSGKCDVSFKDLDPRFRETFWHKQLHIFTVPLYYIEYGIAQLGALALWERSLKEGEQTAVDAYLSALRLGGSRPLPELFKACGIELDFSESNIARLVELAETELDKIPE